MMIDFNDIGGILDESNKTYKKDILDFDAVGEKLLNESSIKESTTNIKECDSQQMKETLYKIVLDWYNATIVGADGFDEEWDEIVDSIEYKLKEQIKYGHIKTVEELIEIGKKVIYAYLGDDEASKFEKIANDACEQDNRDKEFADWVAELESIVNESLNESLHNNDDIINNLISKIEVYKDIVSNSWVPMPWEVAYSKVPEGLKLTIDTDEWFDEENPLGRLIDFILDIYDSDYDTSVRELTGIDIYSDVDFLGGEKSGYATYLIKSSNNNSTELHESIQGTVGDFCKLKGIDTDQFVEFLQTNFDWARHCEAWTIVDFDCLERCFSKLDEATIAQAKRFASRKHGETGAIRKATGQPYIVHPEGVAALVKENGGDDEQIQAAWLHDTIEDTGATYDDIAEKFGKRVADIVSEVTNKPHLKKSEKEAYMTKKLKNLSHDALLVKLCDMRYNYYDYAPIEQRMRIEKNIKELMSSRELTKEEWQLCEEILDWDNTVEGLDENVFSKTLRLSSLNA